MTSKAVANTNSTCLLAYSQRNGNFQVNLKKEDTTAIRHLFFPGCGLHAKLRKQTEKLHKSQHYKKTCIGYKRQGYKRKKKT